MKGKVVKRPEIKLIGTECRTVNSPDRAPQDIPAHWQAYLQGGYFDNTPNAASKQLYALYCDYESDFRAPYTFFLGREVNSFNDVPEKMVTKLIPAATYQIFVAEGEYPQNIIEEWQGIWQSDIPRTYTGDFELYDGLFMERGPKKLDIYVAIKDA